MATSATMASATDTPHTPFAADKVVPPYRACARYKASIRRNTTMFIR